MNKSEEQELKIARLFCEAKPWLTYPHRQWRRGTRCFYRDKMDKPGKFMAVGVDLAYKLNFNQAMLGDPQMLPFMGEVVYLPTPDEYMEALWKISDDYILRHDGVYELHYHDIDDVMESRVPLMLFKVEKVTDTPAEAWASVLSAESSVSSTEPRHSKVSTEDEQETSGLGRGFVDLKKLWGD